MIQDIQPKKLRNEYDPNVKVSDEDFVFIFNDLGVLNKINKAGNRIFPRYKEITKEEGFNNDAENYIYLFKIDDEKYFLYDEPFSELDISGGLLKEYAFTSVRDVRRFKRRIFCFKYSRAFESLVHGQSLLRTLWVTYG